MKRLLLILISICISVDVYSQWQFAKHIGGISVDYGNVKIDVNNNVYCGGNFTTNCYFETDTLISTGSNDMFIAKYDQNGNELWVKKFGGINPINVDEGGMVAAIDNNFNCFYFTGTFYGNLTIDTFTVYSGGIFIAKFDFSGNCLWLKKAGASAYDQTLATTVDSNGNVYFSAQLNSNGTFESYNLNKGCFIAKIDSAGNLLWARDEITGGYLTKIMINNNQLLLSGIAENDTITIDTASFKTPGLAGVFFAKLDLTGGFLYGKKFDSKYASFVTDFELDDNSNVYSVGAFADTLMIDGDTLTNPNSWNFDLYILKIDSNFNKIWVQQSHSNGVSDACAARIVMEEDSNFYVSGYFGGNANFDTINVNSTSARDMFLARFNTNGGCLGIRHFGEAQSWGLDVYPDGDVVVSGFFNNTINIGSNQFTSYGGRDVFIAKSDAITGLFEEGHIANNILYIYANPSQGKCTITIPDEFLNEKKLTLTVFDNAGKVIQQKVLETNDGEIKLVLESEAKGVYNVTLNNVRKSYSGKIIIE